MNGVQIFIVVGFEILHQRRLAILISLFIDCFCEPISITKEKEIIEVSNKSFFKEREGVHCTQDSAAILQQTDAVLLVPK